MKTPKNPRLFIGAHVELGRDVPAGTEVTLRDFFAALALAHPRTSVPNVAEAATWAYELADAMLQQREK